MGNKQMTLGSLFDGSGGFPLGGILAGVTPVWASEIEPFAVRVTTKRLPQMKHYGDVSRVSGAKLPPVDIITFGSPCFPAGTLVLTDKGYLEIEKILPGMKVLTHRGRWRKVTDAGAKIGKTVVVKGNHYGLECTPNHPIYSAVMYRKWKDKKTGYVRYVSDKKEWTPAENMSGRLWAVPHRFEPISIPRPQHDGTPNLKDLPSFSEEFFYLVGRWLGDGWVRDGQRAGRPEGQCSGTVIICAGYEKEEKLKSAVEAVVENYCVERCRTAVKYKFTSLLLCEWLTDNFGKYAHGKEIPSWAFSMPESWRKALLQGVMDTDGHQSTETTYRITTVSKKMAHGLRLLGETLGYSSTVYHVKMPPTCVIEGRRCRQRDQYVAQLVVPIKRSRLSDELHSWYRVRKIRPTGEEKLVYNLTVDEDNSYVAEGIVVHNCQDMSIAGKRSGLDGSRSSLFYEAIRIVKEMRCATNGEKPRFIVWENVPGAFSSNQGEDFKAVLEAVIGIKEPAAEVPAPGKNGWPYADCYLGDGWSMAYRILDAQYWGVPQRRARIFLVADFAGGCAPEILFESEGMSGYSAEGFCAWQRAAGGIEAGAGTAGGADEKAGGRIVLNDQGGERMDVSKDVVYTLRAEARHPPVVMEPVPAAGFCTEHSAKARSIGYEEEKSPTLRAGVVPAAIALDYHPADSRIGIGEPEKIQALTGQMGTGGNNVPLVMEECLAPQTLKIRGGCEGGGKGAQVASDLSATLGCNNDQTVFVPYGICSKASRAMLSDNPHSGFYEAQTSRTLDQNGGRPDCSQGGIAIVAFTQNQRDEVRDLHDKSGALAAEPGMKQQTYVLQGSMIGRSDKNGPQGDGVNEEVSFTLDTSDRHAVAYCMTTGEYTQVEEEKTPTLLARDYKDPPVVAKEKVTPPEPYYIVRRLTPTECARLQGFPDWWCGNLGTENPTDEEIALWTDVFETHRQIVTHAKKPKTEKQIRKWLADPYSDSAEYRLWGNGVALPCVYFVLSGIVWAAGKEK
ncbi:MAG: DNA cytosine methyltransferase [Eubacteriales bacterium]|nr:DNA cytosine methyltransferase [Eubacteriales bacterium]